MVVGWGGGDTEGADRRSAPAATTMWLKFLQRGFHVY